MASAYHPRMPVLFDLDSAEEWVDRRTPINAAVSLLVPYESPDLACYEVSKLVNSPANDSPDCIAPAVPDEDDSSLTLDLF